MALINITRKTTTLQGYQLASQVDMLTALAYLSTKGYSGTVSCYKSNGNPLWQMQLSGDTGNAAPQIGVIGDWVVIENDVIANIVPAAKAAQLYQIS